MIGASSSPGARARLRLFAERGYSATTIDAVATEAYVAVETVYARFKNKRNLFAACLDVSIVGDTEPLPLLDRPNVRAAASMTDQREQLQVLARIMPGILERNTPPHAVLRAATAVDSELEALRRAGR